MHLFLLLLISLSLVADETISSPTTIEEKKEQLQAAPAEESVTTEAPKEEPPAVVEPKEEPPVVVEPKEEPSVVSEPAPEPSPPPPSPPPPKPKPTIVTVSPPQYRPPKFTGTLRIDARLSPEVCAPSTCECEQSVCDECYVTNADACEVWCECSGTGTGSFTTGLCTGWDIYADYLYWNTRRCDLDYAIPDAGLDDGPFVGNVFAVHPDYNSGYRVGVKKRLCDFYLDCFYTHYRNKKSDETINSGGHLAGTRVVGNLVGVTQGGIGLAGAKWKIDYETCDVLGGYDLSLLPCFNAQFFAGFKFAYIGQKLITLYASDTSATANAARVTQRNYAHAYGADLGLRASFKFLSCFELFGVASYDLLATKTKRQFIYDLKLGGSTVFTEHLARLTDLSWKMASVLNFAAGLSYNYNISNCWCSSMGLAIGYEFHSWLNLPDFLDLQAQDEQISFNRHLMSLGFDGLFVRANLAF